MVISLASRDINGFRKWSRKHPPTSNDDDNPGGATPIALVAAPSDRDTMEDRRHRPWVIPGVGGSF
jgi:hypothetical protein